MEYDILYSGTAICLINCRIADEGVYYGFGYYAANTPPIVPLRTGEGKEVITIEVPQEAVNESIMTAMGDHDGLNFAKRAIIQVV